MVTVKMRTSATNLKHPAGCSRQTAALPYQLGFSLIELLVVLAILGLLVAFVPSAYGKLSESVQYRSTLRTIVSDLRTARQRALTGREVASFSVDLDKRSYGIAGAVQNTLPKSLNINVTVGRELITSGKIASIEFLPDGGATGGSIEVIRAGGDGTRVRVDWLSGRVSLERLL